MDVFPITDICTGNRADCSQPSERIAPTNRTDYINIPLSLESRVAMGVPCLSP